MAQGAYRQTGAEQGLAASDARMGEVYWGEFTRNTQGVWSGENTETVIKPEQLLARTVERNGRFATVGTGWEAYPHLLGESPAADLFDGKMLLPQAEDMLPLALQLWENGIRVNPEDAEPTYLRNEVTWKKLPGR